jgi:hypothetical protein
MAPLDRSAAVDLGEIGVLFVMKAIGVMFRNQDYLRSDKLTLGTG